MPATTPGRCLTGMVVFEEFPHRQPQCADLRFWLPQAPTYHSCYLRWLKGRMCHCCLMLSRWFSMVCLVVWTPCGSGRARRSPWPLLFVQVADTASRTSPQLSLPQTLRHGPVPGRTQCDEGWINCHCKERKLGIFEFGATGNS